MLIFPRIKKFQFKIPPKPKKERYISLRDLKNYKKPLKSNTNFPSIISISPTNISNNNSYEKSKNQHSNINSPTVFTSERRGKNLYTNFRNQIKIVNYPTDKLQIEKDIKSNVIKNNNRYKEKITFSTLRENYNNLSNMISNKPINVNKFIENINSFLLPNDKTFEIIQNLINNEVTIDKETSKFDKFHHLLKSIKIPINTYNHGLIFRYLIKNTFRVSLKKALLNKTSINKDEIKEEYQKQINYIKIYLILNNKEKSDSYNNQIFDSLNINNNYTPLISYINNKLYLNKRYDKKMKLEKHGRSRNILQTNFSDKIINKEKNNKEAFDITITNVNIKKNILVKSGTLKSLPDNNNLYKERKEITNQRVILKKKMDNKKEKGLIKLIKKQKISLNDHLKLKEKYKKFEDDLITKENSIQKNIKFFDFLSNNKSRNNYKNEDIINYLNNSEGSIKFENSLIEEKNDRSLLKRVLFDEDIDIGKNSFNNIDENNEQHNKKLTEDNNSQLFNSVKEPIKKDNEKKLSNIKSLKDLLSEENYVPKLKEVNNKVEETKIIDNKVNTEKLIKSIDKEKEEKLIEENWEYQFNDFKNNIKRLKNMSKEEFIKDSLKFIKYYE